jgi:DNA-binding response OmpR family regulator
MATASAVFRVEEQNDYVVRFGDIEVNFDRQCVTRSGRAVSLTSSEFDLLTCFLTNADRDLTRDMILDFVWSYLPAPNTRTVDAHVLRLRQKLEDDPAQPRHFLTLHRVGYRFRP